jgi:L-ascorbate metabolism protein UlaG (beta-lactamase superfamily)
MNGRTLLTDPNWHRAMVVPRLVEAAPLLDELPAIDAVAVSHSHPDHLSMATLRRLARRNPDAVGLVPLGLAKYLRRAGFRQVVELDWWESARVGEVEATLVPARHWSRRGLFDLDRTLWGGWLFAGERRVWFAGDTAFDRELFRSIGERAGELDAALLPIGAYAPEWFMCHQHLRPEDAGEAFLASGARLLGAIHWGTFVLSDEPTLEPPERLRSWWDLAAPSGRELWIPDIGEGIELRARLVLPSREGLH